MARPYPYRDYPLAVFMAIVFIVMSIAQLFDTDRRTIEITLARACASAGECPVVSKLASLSTVNELRHESMDGRGRVSLRADRSLSAGEVWNAIASLPCRPLQMSVDGKQSVCIEY